DDAVWRVRGSIFVQDHLGHRSNREQLGLRPGLRPEADQDDQEARAIPRDRGTDLTESLHQTPSTLPFLQVITQRFAGSSRETSCLRLLPVPRSFFCPQSSSLETPRSRKPKFCAVGHQGRDQAFRSPLFAPPWDAARPSSSRAFPDSASVSNPSNDGRPWR